MDYNGRDEFEGELPEGDATGISAGMAAQDGGDIAAGSRRILTPDAANVVVLPDGAELSALRIDGNDLVITLTDGTVIIVPNSALDIPQLVVDGVAIPAATVSDLLIRSEPEADGDPDSSGGNFLADEGEIQAAYEIADLLPYTDLAFPEQEDEEVIPYNVGDPDVVIETVDQPGGVADATASVGEAGLPARGDEPEGSDAASDVETTVGTIVYDTPDGLGSVTINGTPVTGVGQVIEGEFGDLTIISIDDGEIGFSFTLRDNLDTPDQEEFTVVVTDADGDTDTATLTIDIEDDVPTARNDTDTIAAGTFGPIAGNVITGEGTDTGAEGADTQGADGAVLTAISNGLNEPVENGDGSFTIQGEYGSLTIEADGSYTYARDPNTPGGVSDEFTYTLTDGDGDTDTAVLTIEIENAPVVIISVPTEGDAGTVVDEDGLPPRDGETPGSEQDSDSETTTGTITFEAPDGVDTVQINGVPVTGPGQEIPVDGGTLTIIDFDPDNGTIDYEFTLDDNTDGDNTTVPITVTVTDLDGDSDTGEFEIVIVDDVPTAVDDSAEQDAENAPVTVDAFDNDIPGADSVALDDIAFVEGSLSGTGTVVYNGDGTFTYTPGPGEEGTVTLDYTITDGDGDSSTATVTIDLLDDSTPSIGTEGDDSVDEAALGARDGEPAGSDADSNGEFASGTIPVSTGNDGVGSLVINGVDVTEGGTVTTDKGVLTVTLVDGNYSYSYELTDNTLADPDSDSFDLVLTDSDGDTASTTLVIAIEDDAPSAEDDANSLAAGTFGPVGGNVLDNDTQGADGAVVTSFTGANGSGEAGDTIEGEFGTLTINADGSYTYTRNPGTEGGVTDSFTYTITDGDGDTATADLVITIANAPVTLDLPVAGQDPGTSVEEAGLNPDGSDASSDSESTSGSFTFTAPDGPAIVTIGGVEVTAVGQTITGSFGTLTITSIAPGEIGYTYELTTNTDGDDTQDVFPVTVTDQDGDTISGDLAIDIIDDVPTAVDDTDSLTEGGPISTSGNVITDAEGNGDDGADTPGADGASVQNAGTIPGIYGTLLLNADGSYTYTLSDFGISQLGTLTEGETLVETFDYTLVDGDGDTDSATLTITLNGEDDGVTINGLDGNAPEVVLDEDDLSDGSSPDTADLTQTGNFEVVAPDGLDDVQVNGVSVVAGGVFTAAEVANDGVYSVSITGWTPVFAADGTTVVSATFSYEATLLDNSLAQDEPGEDDIVNMLTVTASDQDGSADSAVLDVQIIDDAPTANPDSDTVGEGQTIVRDADNGVLLSNDVQGADGATVTGVAPGDDDSAPVDGNVGTAIVGQFGTLTLDADGSYTYVSNLDSVAAPGDTDTFVYTITDGDGDTATTTLEIDVTDVTLVADNDDVTVNEAALDTVQDGDDLAAGSTDGSDPASTNETVTGQLSVPGTGVTYSLVSFTGNNGVFELNDDGSYTYTLTDPVDGETADNGANIVENVETVTYVATDANGNTVTGTITIDVVDDVPTARNDDFTQAGENDAISGNVLADNGNGADEDGADGIASVVYNNDIANGATAAAGTLTFDETTGNFTYTPDAGEEGTITFTYTITDGDGDTSTAEVTIELQDDSTPTIGNPQGLTVDEDGLAGANVDGDPLQSDPAETDSTESATDSGSVTVQFGGDAPTGAAIAASIAFINPGDLDGQLTSNGNGITFAIDASGDLVGTFDDNGTPTEAIRIELTGGSATANDGEVEYTYSITLSAPVDQTVAGSEDTISLDNVQFQVTDSDGDRAQGNFSVAIVDDVPTAEDDASADVTEGGIVGGNVLGNDVAGADGFAAAGPVVSVRTQDGSVIDATPDGDGNYVVATALGTLTINQDGTYSYESDPNSTNSDTTDTFIYTIRDADGDEAEATLTIGIDDVAGNVFDSDILVNEAGLPDGSSAGDGSNVDNGQVTVTGATGTLTYALTGGTFDAGANTYTIDGVYGTIVLNAATGEYTYTLDTNFLDSDTTENTTNVVDGAESFEVVVTDQLNNEIGRTDIAVNIVDDVPTATDDSDSLTEGGPTSTTGNLITDAEANGDNGADTLGADGAEVQNTGSFDLTYGTLVIEADGSYTYTLSAFGISQLETLGDNESFTESFDYTLVDGDDDTSTATLTITLNGVDDPVVINGLDNTAPEVVLDEDDLADGSSPDAADLTQTGNFEVVAPDGLTTVTVNGVDVVSGGVFTAAEVANDGVYSVSITGWTPVFAADGTTVISATFTYSATLLDNTLEHDTLGQDSIFEMLTVTASDSDGSNDSATLDLEIVDDVPTLTANTPAADSLSVDETFLDTDATANFANLFVPDYNADGPGSVSGFTLGLNGTATGLTDTKSGEDVVLSLVGGQIQGRTDTGDELVFTISVSDTGVVEFDQLRAVEHDITTDPNDAEPVPGWAANLITLGANVTDADGDTAPAVANIGGAFQILDDGPSITAEVVDEGDVLLTTFDAQTEGTDFDTAVSTGNFSGAFAVATSAGGADGTESITWAFDLSIENAVSGLSSDGDAITLYEVNGVIVGSTAGSAPVDLTNLETNDDVIFTIAVDADTGVVTLTQYQEIDHADNNDTSAPYDDQFAVLANDLVNLEGTATITDGDGDTAQSTVSVDLGGNIRFADDGPSVSAVVNSGSRVTVDETNLAQGTTSLTLTGFTQGSDDDVAGTPTIIGSATTGSVLTVTETFGADGEASGGGLTYELVVTDGTFSGVQTTDGTDVNFVQISPTLVVGVIEGTTTAAVAISIDADTGEVSVEQYVSLFNPDATDPNDDICFNGDTIFAQVTAEDGDGDTATSADVDIASLIFFLDDGPQANPDTNSVTEGASVSGNVLTDGTDDTFGVDGPISASGGVTGVAAGSDTSTAVSGGLGGTGIEGQFGTLVLNSDGSYTYESDPNVVTAPGDTDTFVYTITDGDGDTSTTTLTITINDVTLVADNDTVTVDEDALAIGSNPSSTAETAGGTLNVTGAVSYTLVGDGTGSNGTLALNSTTGEYSYTLTSPVDGTELDDGQDTVEDVDSFSYVAADANGNTVTGTITIDVIDDVPTARDDDFTQANENAAISGNVLADNGNGADVDGADGIESIVYSNDIANGMNAAAGTLDFNETTGAFTYTPGAGEEGEITFTYTIIDSDGDESDATVTIDLLTDSTPEVGTPENLLVDEDGLPGSNTDSSPLQTDPAETDSTESATDTGTVTVDFDGDVPANLANSIEFVNPGNITSNLTGGGLTSNGNAITFAIETATGDIVGTFENDLGVIEEAIRIELTGGSTTATAGEVEYTYEVTLSAPVDQANDDSENSVVLGGIQFQVTDSDGDTATGNFSTTIVDDVPSDFSPDTAISRDGDDPLVDAVTASLNITTGVDTPGTYTFSINDGDPALDSNLQQVTLNGEPLYLYGDGTDVIRATTDPTGAAGDIGFTVTLNGDGTYTFDVLGDLANGTNFAFDDLTGTRAGNTQYVGVGANNAASEVDAIISGGSGNTRDTVNTDSDSIGVGNQSVDNGEAVRIDLVTNLVTDGTTISGFNYDDRVDLRSFEQKIPQVQGNQGEDIAIRVIPIEVAGTGLPNTFDRTPANGIDDGTPVRVTSVTVTEDDGEVNTVDISALNAGDTFLIAPEERDARGRVTDEAIIGRLEADGSVTIVGLQQGDTYAVTTDADFQAIIVQARPTGTSLTADNGSGGTVSATSSQDSFDLGIFSVGTLSAGDDIVQTFDVVFEDADGDTAEGTITTVVDQDGSSFLTTTAAASATREYLDFDMMVITDGEFGANGSTAPIASLSGMSIANDNDAMLRSDIRTVEFATIAAVSAGLFDLALNEAVRGLAIEGFEGPMLQQADMMAFDTNMTVDVETLSQGFSGDTFLANQSIDPVRDDLANVLDGDAGTDVAIADVAARDLASFDFAAEINEQVFEAADSAFAFGGGEMAVSGALMDALLTLEASADTAVASNGKFGPNAAVIADGEFGVDAAEAIGDLAAQENVDAIIEHFAPGSLGDMHVTGGNADNLAQILDGGVTAQATIAMAINDQAEDAAMAAASGAQA